jgi:hypothetical protein
LLDMGNVIRRTAALAAMLLLAAAPAAPALSLVLVDDAEHTTIAIADYPGATGAYVLGWQDVPGVSGSGALVYRRDRDGDDTRYTAIGGEGPVALVDRGRATLVDGTLVPVYDLVAADPRHPQHVVVARGAKVDVPALVARYDAYEGIAAGAARAAIDASVGAHAAQASKACGGKLAVAIEWSSFSTHASEAVAGEAIPVLAALAQLCSDSDYAAAARKLRELRVDYRADGGALRLELLAGGVTLALHLSETSFNPRETAHAWLKDGL